MINERRLYSEEHLKTLQPLTVFSACEWHQLDQCLLKGFNDTTLLVKMYLQAGRTVVADPTQAVYIQKIPDGLVSTPLPFIHNDVTELDEIKAEMLGRSLGRVAEKLAKELHDKLELPLLETDRAQLAWMPPRLLLWTANTFKGLCIATLIPEPL